MADSRLRTAIRSNTQRAANLLQASGISRQQMQFGSVVFAALTFIWLAWRGWIPNIAYMAIGALLWKSLYTGISAGKTKSSNRVRSRKDGETCSTAVFLGSGEFCLLGQSHLVLKPIHRSRRSYGRSDPAPCGFRPGVLFAPNLHLLHRR